MSKTINGGYKALRQLKETMILMREAEDKFPLATGEVNRSLCSGSSNFFLFPKYKSQLRVRHLGNNDELVCIVKEFLED